MGGRLHGRGEPAMPMLTRRHVLIRAASLAPALAATAACPCLPALAAVPEPPAFVLYRGWILTAADVEALGLG